MGTAYALRETPPLPPPAAAETAETEQNGEVQALVQTPQVPEREDWIPADSPMARLPVELDVAVPVRGFRVRNLMTLAPGLVIESQWGHGDDVPLATGDVQLAWAEFEVMDARLAVRLTRLL